MGKGGGKKVDTADSIEARRIAIEEFNDRMRFGAPAEQFYMGQVDRMRTPGQYQRAAGLASAAMQPELEAARTQLDMQNIGRGVAPSSGAFSPAITAGLARSRALGLAESQDAQTSRYFGGASNIVGIGRGQAGQGLQGLGQLAEVSGRRATTEARSAYDTASAQRGLAGTLAGVGAGMYANYKFPQQQTGGGFG
jgi:hypothetical protein